MSTSRNGVFVTTRMIMALIFFSVCINIFFLFMGIVIEKNGGGLFGSSDNAATFAPDEVESVEADDSDEPLVTTALDQSDDSERPDPIDVESLSRGFEENAVKTQSNTSEQTDEAPSNVPEESPPIIEETPVATPPKPEARPDRKPENESKPYITDQGNYYVQLFASKSKSAADDLVNKLEKKGYRAFVSEGGGYHRVRVGVYKSKDEAFKVRDTLKSEMKLDGIVSNK